MAPHIYICGVPQPARFNRDLDTFILEFKEVRFVFFSDFFTISSLSPIIMRNIGRVLGSLALVLIAFSSLTAGDQSRAYCFHKGVLHGGLVSHDCLIATAKLLSELEIFIQAQGVRTDQTFQLLDGPHWWEANPPVRVFVRVLSKAHESCGVNLISRNVPVRTSYANVRSGFDTLFRQCVEVKGLGGDLAQPPLQFRMFKLPVQDEGSTSQGNSNRI
jgi:hypothetical protein